MTMEIEIFTASWDKYYKEVIADIHTVLSECGKEDEAQIKTLNIDEGANAKVLEKYIEELESKFGAVRNPVKAVPLVVIDDKPFAVGIGPKFKEKLKEYIEGCDDIEDGSTGS